MRHGIWTLYEVKLLYGDGGLESIEAVDKEEGEMEIESEEEEEGGARGGGCG